ncbi:PAS domain-containing protein [Haladaptatus sp. NG-WS-4]
MRKNASDHAPGPVIDDRTVRAVLDTLPDVFYVFDASGNLVQWNDRLATVTGTTTNSPA